MLPPSSFSSPDRGEQPLELFVHFFETTLRSRMPSAYTRRPGSGFDPEPHWVPAEEEFGFNATPYVATGKFVKILGL